MAASMKKKLAHFTTCPRPQHLSLHGKLLWRGAGVTLFVALSVTCAFAQAAVEYGSATSGIAGSMSRINLMNRVAFPTTTKEGSSGPSVIMSKPSGQKGTKFIEDTMIKGSITANRQALESRAGKDAGKLMLRSVPNRAYVRINGKIVGRTPLLLVIRPGQYKLSMDGTRMEHAEREVDLLPHETRECSLTLKPRYPTQVEIKLH